MASTVTFTGTRISAAESNTDGGNWNKYASAQNPSDEIDFVLGGVQELSNKISNSTGGVELTATTTVDYSTTARVVMPKLLVSTTGLLDLSVTNALSYFVGSVDDASDFYEYRFFGSQAPYPTDRSWLSPLIDPNIAGYRHITNGTPGLTVIDYYAVYIDTSVGSTVKSENIVHSNLDYFDVGAGLLMTGTDGLLLDFVVEDEDSVDATPSFDNRWRLASRIYGSNKVLAAIGTWILGSSGTSLTMNDLTPQTISWPGGFVGTGTHGLELDLQNTSTSIAIASKVFVSDGKKSITRWFDTALDVDGTNDEIDIIAHGFETGDYVTYTDEGGADTIGLTDTNSYWVQAVTVDAVSFHTTRELALTAGTKVVLTAATAPGENHKLIKADDSRAHYTATGTTATVAATTNSCTFDNFEKFTLTSKNTMEGTKFVAGSLLTLASGTLTSCIIEEPFLDEGAYFVTTSDLDDLVTCDFTAGEEGHAVRMTAATSEGWDHTHSGYWSPATDGWNFITSQAFTSEQINMDANHGFTTGDAVYYNDEGGVASIGLTDGNKYYVNVVDVDTVTVHATKSAAVAGSSAINLTTSGAETHSLYSSKATVFNDTSSGTLTIGVTGGTAPSYRNAPGATTVVNVSVPVSFEAVDATDTAIQDVRITAYLISDDTEIINTTTNASGLATTTFSGTTPADIYYRYRKSSTGAQKYVNLSGFGTIESSTGSTVKRSMREDDIADPSI